jgi:hypothetical protein
MREDATWMPRGCHVDATWIQRRARRDRIQRHRTTDPFVAATDEVKLSLLDAATHRVLTGYSQGAFGVLTGYSQGAHGVLTGYSQGAHRVLKGNPSVSRTR